MRKIKIIYLKIHIKLNWYCISVALSQYRKIIFVIEFFSEQYNYSVANTCNNINVVLIIILKSNALHFSETILTNLVICE